MKTTVILSLSLLLCGAAWPESGAFAARETDASQVSRVEGFVRDQRGDPVVGATVELREGERIIAQVSTDAAGRFVFEDVTTRTGAFIVRAQGFAPVEREWNVQGDATMRVEIALAPASLAERVTVTATRTETRLGETAASVFVLAADEIENTAALVLDDALRQVPGFQLFRRAGSRTANPTAQGVSLRGVGPSGASRALVLADGIPLNDPFGGWVYWGRVPRESIRSVEIVRGGASSLYGSGALGGVVQLFTREADASVLSLQTSLGNLQTGDASFFGAVRRGRWSASLSAEALHTDGHILVSERERGSVDTPAGTRYVSSEATIERLLPGNGRIFARGSYFAESRENGTPLQTNRTRLRRIAAGADWRSERAGAFSLRSYASTQVYDQSFSAIAADRESETLSRLQRVPSQAAGLSAQWSRGFAGRHTVVLGLDAREVRGASDETGFAAGRANAVSGAGGRERSMGFFAQESLRVSSRLMITAGGRFDRWRNYDARTTTRQLSQTATTVVDFPDRSESAFSPHLSSLFKPGDSLTLTASFYRAFRAPTLNELYRSFRVGNIVTLADENLRAERLTGGEAGLLYAPAGRGFSLRGNLFASALARPVANVTLAATPALITRQRRNLGRTRSIGVEVEAEKRLGERWSVSGGYLLIDARVGEFPADLSLEGLRVPQVARQQLTVQARYVNPALLSFAVQGRASGRQFEDDRNAMPLAGFFTLDARASRRLTRGVDLFIAGENLTGRRYEVGRTPVLTIGPPALVRAGLKVRLGPR